MSNEVSKPASGSHFLWAAVGALGVAVIALGALLYEKSAPTPAGGAGAPAAVGAVSAPAGSTSAAQATKVPGHADTKSAAQGGAAGHAGSGARHGAPMGAANAPTAPAPQGGARSTCANCATVTAVTPVEREGQTSGTGAVAGGVLGAVVGNQFGGGDGKTLTTILGAVGGGMAGNEVEKRMKKVTVYEVRLRMDDGQTRTLEMGSPTVGVGSRVRVEGNALQPL